MLTLEKAKRDLEARRENGRKLYSLHRCAMTRVTAGEKSARRNSRGETNYLETRRVARGPSEYNKLALKLGKKGDESLRVHA